VIAINFEGFHWISRQNSLPLVRIFFLLLPDICVIDIQGFEKIMDLRSHGRSDTKKHQESLSKILSFESISG